MVARVVSIKTKSQTFEDWLREVVEENGLDGEGAPKSAIIFWEVNTEGAAYANCARFQCGFDEIDWYHRCLEDTLFKERVGKFLAEHIGEFIQYI